MNPPSSKTDKWKREDVALFGQLLNIKEPKIQDLVMHISIVKKMWNYLEELHSEKNNLYRAFNIIQEMFQSKKRNKTLS